VSGDFSELPGIAGDAWQEALGAAKVIDAPAGAKLTESRASGDRLVIVLAGTVKVSHTSENGREITLYRISAGQLCPFTLPCLLRCTPSCVRAEAEEDVSLLAVPRQYVARLLAECPDFRNYLLSGLAYNIAVVTQLVAQVSFEQLDRRLANLLLRRSRVDGSLRLRCTHQSLASELGCTREVISRLLKEFERAGYIRLGRCCVEIVDEPGWQCCLDGAASEHTPAPERW
jgi:CRP/FNR family transcriptional regulator